MRTITFVTQKGGTGKTTIAMSLAVAAQEAGETVAVLDLDVQESAYLWGQKRQQQAETAEKKGKTEDAERLDRMHVQKFPLHRIAEIAPLVKSLKDFSLVVIDTPGVDSTITHHAMKAADLCLLPLQPSVMEAEAMRPTLTALIDGKIPYAMILNRCLTQPGNTRASQMANQLRKHGIFAEPLIHGLTDFQDAMGRGLGVTEYNAKGTAAHQIRELWTTVNAMTKTVNKGQK